MTAQATVPLEKAKKLEPQKGVDPRGARHRLLPPRNGGQEAEREFRVIVEELAPTDDYAHYALGRALEQQGRTAEANGHYKLASSMKPTSEQYAPAILDLDGEGGRPARLSRPLDAGRRDRRAASACSSGSRLGDDHRHGGAAGGEDRAAADLQRR